MTDPHDAAPASGSADGAQPAARPLADLMRELADAADANEVRKIPVHAETLRAWADETEALEATKNELLTHILNVPSDHFGDIDITVANWLGAGIKIIKHYGIPDALNAP